MKRLPVVTFLTLGLAAGCFAADFHGFVEDQRCSSLPDMKDNGPCAQQCIQNGQPAVLVTEDGKIYKVANQAKVTPHAGEHVKVTGDLKGDTLTVSDIKPE